LATTPAPRVLAVAGRFTETSQPSYTTQ